MGASSRMNYLKFIIIYIYLVILKNYDSVAQLDRAFDFESKGWGFESSRGRQYVNC